MRFLRRFALLLFVAGLPVGAGAAVIVDSAGRQVAVPDAVAHVLPAGPPASVALFALAPDKMAGWIQPLSAAQLGFIPPRYASLPAVGRLTQRDGNPAELVRIAHPDLIVDIGDVDRRYADLADKVQKETGVPYLLFSGSLAEIGSALRKLGPILGNGAEGERLAKYVATALAEAHKLAARPAAAHPKVYFARGDGLLMPVGGNGPAEFLRLLGVRMLAAKPDVHGNATVTLDRVRAWQPDYIVTDEPGAFDAVTHHPEWRMVKAVKDGHVLLAPAGPFGWLDHPPSLNRVMGLRWLARKLYPRAFKDDLRPVTAAFYRLAYHQEPAPAQLDLLLQESPAHR